MSMQNLMPRRTPSSELNALAEIRTRDRLLDTRCVYLPAQIRGFAAFELAAFEEHAQRVHNESAHRRAAIADGA